MGYKSNFLTKYIYVCRLNWWICIQLLEIGVDSINPIHVISFRTWKFISQYFHTWRMVWGCRVHSFLFSYFAAPCCSYLWCQKLWQKYFLTPPSQCFPSKVILFFFQVLTISKFKTVNVLLGYLSISPSCHVFHCMFYFIFFCRHKKVVYLDSDVGQPEFTPPGFLSLTVVDRLTPGNFVIVLCCFDKFSSTKVNNILPNHSLPRLK